MSGPPQTPASEAAGSTTNLWPNTLAIFGILVGAAVAGFMGGLASPGASPRQGQTVGGIKFTIPNGWTALSEPPEAIWEPLAMSEARAYAPGGNEDEGTAVVGASAGKGPRLLSLERGVAAHQLASPAVVGLEQSPVAVRVSLRLSPRQGLAQTITAYSVPTTGKTVNIICLEGSQGDLETALAACGRLASTVEVPRRDGEAVELLTLVRYRRELRAAIDRYDGERALARERLAAARSASGQRTAAAQAAGSCSRAASSIDGLPPNPIAEPTQARLYRALTACARAYASLSSAAASGSKRGYAKACKRIEAADVAVSGALAQILTP